MIINALKKLNNATGHRHAFVIFSDGTGGIYPSNAIKSTHENELVKFGNPNQIKTNIEKYCKDNDIS